MNDSLNDLVGRARTATPNDRIDLRNAIAAHGAPAIEAMAEWLADPELTRFAVRVIGRTADSGHRELAVLVLDEARQEATPDQRIDIDDELRRLGVTNPAHRRRGSKSGDPPDPSVPGWMMPTDRSRAGPMACRSAISCSCHIFRATGVGRWSESRDRIGCGTLTRSTLILGRGRHQFCDMAGLVILDERLTHP